MTGPSDIEDSVTRKNLIGDVLTAHKTHKEDNGHQKPNGAFETVRGDCGTSLTLGGDNRAKGLAREHKTHEGGSDNTLKKKMALIQLP